MLLDNEVIQNKLNNDVLSLLITLKVGECNGGYSKMFFECLFWGLKIFNKYEEI